MPDTRNKLPRLIFIVEDNAMYAKSLEFFLKSRFEGVEINIFPVGELCVDNLDKNPDLIVMDYELNTRYYDAENGVSILKEIKSQKPKTEVVVLSSRQEESLVQEIKDSGSIYFNKNEQAFKNIENHISILVINKLHNY